jgi:hypothetical protein
MNTPDAPARRRVITNRLANKLGVKGLAAVLIA